MATKMTETNTSSKSKMNHHQQQADNDIATLILEDHKSLKRLIPVLKDEELEFDQRKIAFDDFAVLLVSHAKPEEQTLYMYMKSTEDLREDGFEGDVEHEIADQLLEEIKRTEDVEVWSARVKVLAELVEHHIKEEEQEMIPEFKRRSPQIEREEMGEIFLELKTELLEKGGEDTCHEQPQQTQNLPVH